MSNTERGGPVDRCTSEAPDLEAEVLRLFALKRWAELRLDATVRSLRQAEEALASTQQATADASGKSGETVLYHVPAVAEVPHPEASTLAGHALGTGPVGACAAAGGSGSTPPVIRLAAAWVPNGRSIDLIA